MANRQAHCVAFWHCLPFALLALSQALGKEAQEQQDEASLLAALQTHISTQWLTEEHPAVIQARAIGAFSWGMGWD